MDFRFLEAIKQLRLSAVRIWVLVWFCVFIISRFAPAMAQVPKSNHEYHDQKDTESIISRSYTLAASQLVIQGDSLFFTDLLFKNIKFQIINADQILESQIWQGQLDYMGYRIAMSGFVVRRATKQSPYYLQIFTDAAFWNDKDAQNGNSAVFLLNENPNSYPETALETNSVRNIFKADGPDTLAIEKVWLWQNAALQPVWQLRKSFVESQKKSATYYLSLDCEDTLLELPLNLHSDRPPIYYPVRPPDTLARFWVFMPDPLTSAQVNYGSPYLDNNDVDSPFLTAQLKTKSAIVYKYNGLYRLENDKVRIAEFDPPLQTICHSAQPFFYFTRANDCFEQANTFWHLSSYISKISQLGFDILTWPQVDADAGALNNADQSMYSPMLEKLYFGQGNVDDAEDADVIIHEYTHALLHRAASFTNIGFERRTLEEGNCDYMAADYSAQISGFNNNRVYNWDGNNVFWAGRSVATTKDYLTGRIGNIYTDGEIWSSTIMQIRAGLGSALTNRLLVYSWFGYYPNMRMADAANLFLQADTILNNSINTGLILQAFRNRRILNPTSITKSFTDFTVIITNHLMPQSSLPIYVECPLGPVRAILINSLGQRISSYPLSPQLSIPTQNLVPGIYWLEIYSDNNAKRIKIIR